MPCALLFAIHSVHAPIAEGSMIRRRSSSFLPDATVKRQKSGVAVSLRSPAVPQSACRLQFVGNRPAAAHEGPP
jgi:hypothetical protein